MRPYCQGPRKATAKASDSSHPAAPPQPSLSHTRQHLTWRASRDAGAALEGFMFFIYLRRELRRRMRQVIFISLGLAIGIGLVITVTAASAGAHMLGGMAGV